MVTLPYERSTRVAGSLLAALAFFQNQFHWRTFEWKSFSDLVFEEAHIGEMSEGGVIAIKHESWRRGVNLRAIINPERFAGARRRLVSVLRVY